jgi:hypothetical protein
VDQGKFAPAGLGRPPELFLRSGDGPYNSPEEHGKPARAAPAERGHLEATVWRNLGTLKGRVIRGAVPLRASDAVPGSSRPSLGSSGRDDAHAGIKMCFWTLILV